MLNVWIQCMSYNDEPVMVKIENKSNFDSLKDTIIDKRESRNLPKLAVISIYEKNIINDTYKFMPNAIVKSHLETAGTFESPFFYSLAAAHQAGKLKF